MNTKIQKTLMTLTLACAGWLGFAFCSLQAEAADTWTFTVDASNATKGTITDGDWTLNVLVSGNALTIGTKSPTHWKDSDATYHWKNAYTANVKPSANNAVVETGADGKLDLSKPIADGKTITGIGFCAFLENTDLKELCLPETLTIIGNGSFYKCTNLEKVTPLLPQSLKTLRAYAFANCTSLKQMVDLSNPDGVALSTLAFSSSGITGCHISAPITTVLDSTFANCANLTNIELPATLTSMGSTGSGVFLYTTDYATANGGPSCLTIKFRGDMPEKGSYAWFYSYQVHYSKKACFYIPKSIYEQADSQWAQLSLTEMTDALLTEFQEKFPAIGETPVGLVTIDKASVWVVPYDDTIEPGSVLVDSNLDEKLGSPSPSYGSCMGADYSDFSLENSFAVLNGKLYRALGYKVYKNTSGNWVEVSDEASSELSWTYDAEKYASAALKLEWQFSLVGHSVVMDDCFAPYVTMTSSSADAITEYEGVKYCAPNTQVTLAPATDSLLNITGWKINGIVSQGSSATITVQDEAVSISPVCAARETWTYIQDSTSATEGNSGRLTDGEWILRVREDRSDNSKLVVGTRSLSLAWKDGAYAAQQDTQKNLALKSGVMGPEGRLDLSKPIEGKTLSIIGVCAFLDNDLLKEVILPQTLTTVSYGAFKNCSSLTNLTFRGDMPTFKSYALSGLAKKVSLFIPKSLFENPESAWAAITADTANYTAIAKNDTLWNEFVTTLGYTPKKLFGLYTVECEEWDNTIKYSSSTSVWMHTFADKEEGFRIIVR